MKERDPEEADRQAVIDQILSAFGHVRLEDGVTLHETEVLDDYGSDEKRAQARLKDTETRWQDVSAVKLERFDKPAFLDVKGFRFYLPAYMVWAMKSFRTAKSLSIDFYLYCMRHPGHDAEYFDVEQSKAILSFLRFVVKYAQGHMDTATAQKAIDRYFGRFSEDP
jgi:hypothetical protein